MRTTANATTGWSGAVVMSYVSTIQPRGGRDLPPPPVYNRTVTVRMTDDPTEDRHVSVTTVRLAGTYAYQVAVIDSLSRPTQPPRTYTELHRARAAANRIYNRITEEND